MSALLVRRLVILSGMLVAVSLISFLLPYAGGADPALAVLRARSADREPSPEVLAQLRAELGLDRPVLHQYFNWLGQLARGDLGYSYVSRMPVGETLVRGLKVTFELSVFSLGLAVLVAIPLGVMAALRPGGRLDTLIAAISQVGVAVPEYWLAPALILLFAHWLGWLPSAGWGEAKFMVMPAFTLALRPIAYFTRITRVAMIEVLQMDFIRAGRAKGLTEVQVIWRHALRNALVPVVTMVTLWIAGLLSGSVIVEVIFAVPGLGRILYEAVVARDLPLVQATLVLTVALAVIINTLTDLAYMVLNPAIRLDRSQT